MAATAIVTTPDASPFIRTLSPAQLLEAENEARDTLYGDKEEPEFIESNLIGHIRKQWDMMRRHRTSAAGWTRRLLDAQRAFNREYSPQKLAEISQFEGSTAYAGLIATKCRGTTSLLREVYLEGEKPWGLKPTPDPSLPDNISEAISALVEAEIANAQSAGEQLQPEQIEDRIKGLVEQAMNASQKQAREQAKRAEQKVDDLLVEGGFYDAFAQFLVDLPIFCFACIKGPVVRVVPDIVWEKQEDGTSKAVQKNVAKLFWNRVSPFDLFFTPGVSDIRDADVIEITRYTRSDLNALIGVQGFREDQIRLVLENHGARGLHEWMDDADTARAQGENRENPHLNESRLIDCIEFHGNIQGKMLLDWGMSDDEVPDADVDYFVQAWVIGRYAIKVQLNPSPRNRAPYYITSFEKVPGTPVGNALPDILSDIQDSANAALRSLQNNMAMASGPQVVINDNRIAPGGDNESLYPWKRWHVTDDPFNSASASVNKPVDFFQPQSNAQEYMGLYEKFWQMADELSAIPRYTTGSDRMGGAGRTASGLAMLMGNANKILKTVCANIDREVLKPLIEVMYDFLLLYDKSGLFQGDANIDVKGVQVAVQKETNRQRQLEFLQATGNPIDMQIMGVPGRATLLRSVSSEIGLQGETIVPDENTLKQQMQQAAEQQAMQMQQEQAMDLKQNGERGVARRATKPSNTNLGVPEAEQMRGITR